MKHSKPNRWVLGAPLMLLGQLALVGCQSTPFDFSEFTSGPAPLREPGMGQKGAEDSYEASLQGHKIFDMYCASCHNARALAERPFANYQNAAQHMRVRANLTGEEYAKLLVWLRRWHDVPAPEQRETAPPNRFYFSQPINELQQDHSKTAPGLQGGPRSGTMNENSPGQPPSGSSPQEAR